jgi:hypothetical protein
VLPFTHVAGFTLPEMSHADRGSRGKRVDYRVLNDGSDDEAASEDRLIVESDRCSDWEPEGCSAMEAIDEDETNIQPSDSGSQVQSSLSKSLAASDTTHQSVCTKLSMSVCIICINMFFMPQIS